MKRRISIVAPLSRGLFWLPQFG